MRTGRPSKYTEELAERICQLVATNPLGLPKLCDKFPELPTAETIRVWRWERRDFSARYTEAKQHQAELMAESIEDVIDELDADKFTDEKGARRIDSGLVAQARLRMDARRWTACKLAPKIYGERKQDDSSNPKETLTKIQSIVNEFNKTNNSDI